MGRFRECDKPLTLIKNTYRVFLEVIMGVRLKLEKENWASQMWWLEMRGEGRKRNWNKLNDLNLIYRSVLNLMKWKSLKMKYLKKQGIDEGGGRGKWCKTDETKEK